MQVEDVCVCVCQFYWWYWWVFPVRGDVMCPVWVMVLFKSLVFDSVVTVPCTAPLNFKVSWIIANILNTQTVNQFKEQHLPELELCCGPDGVTLKPHFSVFKDRNLLKSRRRCRRLRILTFSLGPDQGPGPGRTPGLTPEAGPAQDPGNVAIGKCNCLNHNYWGDRDETLQ